jgi:hypothetical protein
MSSITELPHDCYPAKMKQSGELALNEAANVGFAHCSGEQGWGAISYVFF